MLPKIVHNSWEPVFADLSEELENIRLALPTLRPYYPEPQNIFAAFQIPFPPKCCVVAQDPYPQKGLATGIAFAVPKKQWSASLEIIFNEVATSTYDVFYKGDETMKPWLDQGVLLLNSSLTVRPEKPNDARHVGLWMPFMKKLCFQISRRTNVPWCLWGDRAKKLKPFISSSCLLESVHPMYDYYSFEPRFKGTAHFKKINEYFSQQNQSLIKW